MKNQSLIFSLLTLLCACSVSNHTQPSTTEQSATEVSPSSAAGIIGGEDVAAIDSLSSSTVAVYDQGAGNICTGSLIADHWVLTAAHCLSDGPSEYAILFVTNDNVPVPQDDWKKVSRAFRHPQYSTTPTVENDLALIQFEGPMIPGYTLVNLPDGVPSAPAGYDYTAIGFGATTGVENIPQDQSNGVGVLRKVGLHITSYDRQNSKFKVQQSQGHGICFGDSGGPALIDYKNTRTILGVVSYVEFAPDLKDRCAQTSSYTNLVPYLDWIRASLQPAPAAAATPTPTPAPTSVPMPKPVPAAAAAIDNENPPAPPMAIRNFSFGETVLVDSKIPGGPRLTAKVGGFAKTPNAEFVYDLQFSDGHTETDVPDARIHKASALH